MDLNRIIYLYYRKKKKKIFDLLIYLKFCKKICPKVPISKNIYISLYNEREYLFTKPYRLRHEMTLKEEKEREGGRKKEGCTMRIRGINLYRIEPAGNVQRSLVSLSRYLANENYDLTSTRLPLHGRISLPGISTSLFSISFPLFRLRPYAYPDSRLESGWSSCRAFSSFFSFSFSFLLSRSPPCTNSTYCHRYLNKNNDEDSGNSGA